MRTISLLISIAAIIFFLTRAEAQNSNSRGWMYLQQTMVGGASSTTSSSFSAFNSVMPFKYYAVSVSGAGSGGFNLYLESSLDNVNFTPFFTTTTASGVGFVSNASPSLYVRLRSAGLGAGKVITATAIGVP